MGMMGDMPMMNMMGRMQGMMGDMPMMNMGGGMPMMNMMAMMRIMEMMGPGMTAIDRIEGRMEILPAVRSARVTASN